VLQTFLKTVPCADLTAGPERCIRHDMCYKKDLAVDRKGATMADASGGKEPRKREPVIIAAWIGGVLGVAGIVAGVLLSHALGGSPQPEQSSAAASSPPAAANSNVTPTSSSATTATTQPRTTTLGGTITVPPNGSTAVYVTEQLHASGTTQNVPSGNHLELFLQYKTYPPFYAAGNPENVIKLDTSTGQWSGVIYIGEAEPCTLWLVDLTPAEAQQMNQEVSDQSAGYPTLPGTVLAHVSFTAA
jgi:hypothetical protein